MEKPLKLLLSQYGLNLKKAYGQNFLTDDELLSQIVEKAGVTKEDTVLEIGCGAGALTAHLAENAKKVVCYEIDQRLKPLLNETVGHFSNVEIVFGDIMKQKINDVENKLGGEYIMVANLPYYITTPIIMQFIENAKNIKSMVIMVQEEVAYRLSANAGTSDYGAITVGINLRGKANVIIKVPRDKFTPPPNVDSAVVKIDIDKNKFNGVDFSAVRNLVRCGFTSRRKTLINNLMTGLKISRADGENALKELDINLLSRAEDLTASQFVDLTKKLNIKGNKK